MNRNRFFWGLLVTLLGVLLLLNTLGILTLNVWQVFWPLILIILGGWMLLGPIFFKRKMETEEVTLPLNGAASLKVKIAHGAGRLTIASAPAGSLTALSGAFTGGVEKESIMDGSELKIKLNAPHDFFWNMSPMGGFEGLAWNVNVNQDVPLKLIVQSGANESHLDLSSLKISELNLDTGASSTFINLPAAAGYSRVFVKSGAASVQLHVPEGVAARFAIKHGLAGINVDTNRFVNNGDVYETPGFASAANRIECDIETGVGSIEIR